MYLYIDAGYLRRVFQDRLSAFLGREIGIHWPSVKEELGAQRVFFYDSVDDIKRAGESETDFQLRQRNQEAQLDSIASLDGYFVRLGSFRGDAKRRRQKEVDVLLAVDMLTHSHRRNMSRAILIAGDLDFKPVVEAVVEKGTLVTLVFEPRTGSRDLARAADSQTLLTLRFLWNISLGPRSNETSELFPRSLGSHYNVKASSYKTGTINGKPVRLFDEGDYWLMDLSELDGNLRERFWSNSNKQTLLNFISEEFGQITW